MTFIIAIQLEDGVVVAVDNKNIQLKDKNINDFEEYDDVKLYGWDGGVITETGEMYVIDKAIRLFINNAESDLKKLPECLNISRQIREMEVGQHEQIQSSKLLYSSFSDSGAKIFAVECDETDVYRTREFQNNDVIVWFFNQNIQEITQDLNNLYSNARSYSSFEQQADGFNYYLHPIAEIFYKQSQVDTWMSSSFNICFQTRNQCFSAYIHNQRNDFIKGH